jgi:shikimate dehydrogenase
MKTFGLVGKSLSHSFSKDYFTEKFRSQNLINYSYKNFEIDNVSELNKIILEDEFLSGLNVTIPFKKDVISILDELDEVAAKIGAVNTIKISRHKDKLFLKGFNTDVYGFQFSIKPFLTLHHQKALILGTGGASKAVAFVLKNLGIDYLFVSRTNKNFNTILYEELNDYAIMQHKLIINCTPVGMFPKVNETVNIPYNSVGKDHLCVDLIYNPIKTKFLEEAEIKGAIILNGLSMLQLQADKSFEIFTQ